MKANMSLLIMNRDSYDYDIATTWQQYRSQSIFRLKWKRNSLFSRWRLLRQEKLIKEDKSVKRSKNDGNSINDQRVKITSTIRNMNVAMHGCIYMYFSMPSSIVYDSISADWSLCRYSIDDYNQSDKNLHKIRERTTLTTIDRPSKREKWGIFLQCLAHSLLTSWAYDLND